MAATQSSQTKTSGSKPDEEFAVIETGGKQYRVSVGDTIAIEKIPELQTGDSVKFEKVLLVDDGKNTSIGEPYLNGASVEGEVSEVGNKKTEVIRYRSKKRYYKNRGHGQPFMKVKVTAIK